MNVGDAFTDKIYKCVLSNPVSDTIGRSSRERPIAVEEGRKYKKITLSQIGSPGKVIYHAEKLTETQAFHENLSFSEARELLRREFGAAFRQCNMWDGEYEYSLKITGKGKLLQNRRAIKAPPKDGGSPHCPGNNCDEHGGQGHIGHEADYSAHDRVKNYILSPGDIPPLVDMGIFTGDGRVVKSMYGKYRQVNRFLEIVDDEVTEYVRKYGKKSISVVDFGCGKSWLTFVLYHYLTAVCGLDAKVAGLDLKRDVVEDCQNAAEKYGYAGLKFVCGDIKDYQPEGPVDMVVCLHACDVATDYALYNAVRWGAGMIFCVPCCQHELNAQVSSREFSLLTRYGVIKERFAALMTDAVRADVLEYLGYRTQVLEFTDMDSTPKNLMIRAVRTGRRNEAALAEAERAMREFGTKQRLYELARGEIMEQVKDKVSVSYLLNT